MLHVPTVLIPSALGGGDGGARVAWPEGSIYRGPAGLVISPGPGYPHDSTAQGADGAGPLVSALIERSSKIGAQLWQDQPVQVP